MDLSNPRLKKILIFAAIFTVIVFIAVKIWRRSYYSYPNTAEDAQFPITAMIQSQAEGVVTVTAPGHKFKVGDIVLLKNTGVTTITSTTGVIPTVEGITETPVIVDTVQTDTSFTFRGSFTGNFSAAGNPTAEAVGFGKMTDLKTALVACQDTYAQEIISGVAPATAVATRTGCIARAVAPYTRGHCKWLPAEGENTIPVPLAPTGNAQPSLERAAYNTYQENIKTIQLAYVKAANRAAAGTFTSISNTTKATDIVSAARAADITGATQKYLATVCPGFYQPGDPAAADPSTNYIAWTATSSPADSVQTTQKHFWASSTTGITDAAILTWAQYARPVTFTSGQGLTSTTGYLTGLTISGYSDKSASGNAPNENWRLAYSNGPGTVPSPFSTTSTPVV